MRPRHIVLFIACCFALVGGLVVLGNLYRPLLGDIRCPEVGFLAESQEKFEVRPLRCLKLEVGDESDTTETLVPMELADSIGLEEELLVESRESRVESRESRVESRESKVESQESGVESGETKVESGVLELFIAGLQEAENKQVRVVHYGDSQIEEDRITSTLRSHLQEQYGGIGPGLLPLVQTIPTRTVVQSLLIDGQRVTPKNGPQRWLVYGPKAQQRDSNNHYGVMGQVAVMNDSLVSGSEEVIAICTPQDNNARYNTWCIFADSSVHYRTSGDSVYLSGKGSVYALSQESKTGVIVDNIPMRGCLGTVFTKIDRQQLSSFYREQNVTLIIMQFGGNAIPFNRNPSTISSIVKGLREQVRYLQSCAPEASILFIGPSDMLTQENGEWITYPMIPYMDRLLRKMAMEENIAYFSLFNYMGGAGSMARWKENGLAGSDGIHFMRSGARKAGNAVVQWILEGIQN